jgi:hypothetical protein
MMIFEVFASHLSEGRKKLAGDVSRSEVIRFAGRHTHHECA